MDLIEYIKLDIKANSGNPKGKFISVSYRIAHFFYLKKKRNVLYKLIAYPILKLYRFLFYWFFCIEIPESVNIGYGLQIWHGFGIVINPDSIIGNNILLRHTTTIGNKYEGSGCPIIGNNVTIGAHSIIIGDIHIEDNVTIGAGSVITKSIKCNHIAYGSPLKIWPKEQKKQ